MLSSCLGVSLGELTCPACAPWVGEIHREDLAHCSPPMSHHRPCHARAVRALPLCHAVAEYALGARWLTPCWAGPVVPGPARPGQGLLWGQAAIMFVPGRAVCASLTSWAARLDSAHGAGFEFQFLFNSGSSLNFKNSYLFKCCSKIHEINSVGFLNSISFHEKYKTK
jgi:hypothetical protein